MFSKIIISVFLITGALTFAQGTDISDYLKKIEAGNREEVKASLPELKTRYANDPDILFLEGVLTENGPESINIFSKVANKYPQSRYADAAVFRIYSYYYVQGSFDSAIAYLSKLKSGYPSSPYIKMTEKNTPVIDESNDNRPAIDPLPPNLLDKKIVQKTDKKTDKKNEAKLNFKYTIQAGAFSNKENAELLKKQFADGGFTSEVTEKEVAGTTFHIVNVGKFVTEREAKEFLTNINSEYSLDGRVVKIN